MTDIKTIARSMVISHIYAHTDAYKSKFYEVTYENGRVEHENLCLTDIVSKEFEQQSFAHRFISSDGEVVLYYADLAGLGYYYAPKTEFLIQTALGTCMNKLRTIDEIKSLFEDEP